MPFVIDLTNDGHLAWPPTNADTGKRLMKNVAPHWQSVLKSLAKGPVADDSGLATAKLLRKSRYRGSQQAFVNLLTNMEDTGLITRDINGRRTNAITLAIDVEALPPEWFSPSANGHAAEVDATPATVDSGGPEAEGAPSEPGSLTDDSGGLAAMPDLEPLQLEDTGVDYGLLATALLERVVELATSKSDSEDTYDRGVVLSVQLSHANQQAEKLRKRVGVLEKEVAISAGVVKTYRVRLAEEERQHRGTEANLRQTLSVLRKLDARQALSEDHRNALAKLLKEVPISPDTQRNVD